MNPIAILATACGLGLAAESPAGVPDTRSLETWIEAERTSGRLAAASLARIDGAKLDVSGFGSLDGSADARPDADSQFQIGSITKVYTHLLLAESVAADELRYDSTLADLLPEGARLGNPALAGITLEALASHRSGLPRVPPNLDLGNTVDPYAGYDESKLLEGLAMARAQQPLGSFYTYSNFGVGLLGYVLGRRDGAGYRAALEERVIAPMRLVHTGFRPGKNAARAIQGGKPVSAWGFDDALAGAGSLWGSAGDLGRLVQAYLGHHEHGLKHTLAEDLRVLGAAGDFEITRVWHVARADGQPVYWHNGGTAGFHSVVGFRPDLGAGVAVLVSGDSDPTDVALRALGVAPIEPREVAVDESVFGQYQLGPQFGIGVYRERGLLVAQASGQPAFELHALGEDWYALGEVDAALHFLREDGQVQALELAQGGQLQQAPRTHPVALSQQRQEIQVDATVLAALAGKYRFAPGVELEVSVDGQQLLARLARLAGQPTFPVYPRSADRYFYKVVDAELAFERDAQGEVTAVVLHQGGIEQRATRVR
ncbi:MAG: hypothetical protein AMXMBFR25_29060 [Lysobacterales bacterium]